MGLSLRRRVGRSRSCSGEATESAHSPTGRAPLLLPAALQPIVEGPGADCGLLGWGRGVGARIPQTLVQFMSITHIFWHLPALNTMYVVTPTLLTQRILRRVVTRLVLDPVLSPRNRQRHRSDNRAHRLRGALRKDAPKAQNGGSETGCVHMRWHIKLGVGSLRKGHRTAHLHLRHALNRQESQGQREADGFWRDVFVVCLQAKRAALRTLLSRSPIDTRTSSSVVAIVSWSSHSFTASMKTTLKPGSWPVNFVLRPICLQKKGIIGTCPT